MIQDVPAMSNAERQRKFRERNPGYYGRLQAAKRASIKRGAALLFAQHMAAHPDAYPATTLDVVPMTAVAEVAEIAPMPIEIVPATAAIVAPTVTLASPAFEVVADSPDVFLRIFAATPADALAA